MISSPLTTGWNGKEFFLEKDLVVARENCSELFVLNDTARAIWVSWRDGLSIPEISARLANDYQIPVQLVQQDVETAVVEWKNKGLIGDIPKQSYDAASHQAEPECLSEVLPASSEWRAEYIYQLHDFLIRIRFENVAVEKAVHSLFAHLVVDNAHEVHSTFEILQRQNIYLLHVNGRLVVSDRSLDSFVMGVFREITHAACFHADPFLVMHAAAVADGNDCIVMPGSGGSGKSTLTAALISDAGYYYLSDDMVPLERETLQAIPFPISLNVKKESLPIVEKLFGNLKYFREYKHGKRQAWYLQMDDCHLNLAHGSYSIKFLVFPKYSPGTVTSLSSISSAEALQSVFRANSIYYEPLDISCISSMVEWIGKVPAFHLTYESLDEAVNIINSLFSSS